MSCWSSKKVSYTVWAHGWSTWIGKLDVFTIKQCRYRRPMHVVARMCTFCLVRQRVSSKPIQLWSVKCGRVSGPTGRSLYTRTDSGSLIPIVSLPIGYILLQLLVLVLIVEVCVIVFSTWFLVPLPALPALLAWYNKRAIKGGNSSSSTPPRPPMGGVRLTDGLASRTFSRQTLTAGSLPLCQEWIPLPPTTALMHLPKTPSSQIVLA